MWREGNQHKPPQLETQKPSWASIVTDYQMMLTYNEKQKAVSKSITPVQSPGIPKKKQGLKKKTEKSMASFLSYFSERYPNYKGFGAQAEIEKELVNRYIEETKNNSDTTGEPGSMMFLPSSFFLKGCIL